MEKYLTESKDIRHEYCCTVVRIGKLMPIEGKDRIVQTLVNGMSMVVRKDQVKEGDIMIYAMNETALSEKFLSANNLYDIQSCERNANYKEVEPLLESDREKARTMCGFFNKYGRVKRLKLGGVPSYGYIFSIDELAKAYPDVLKADLESMVDKDFDTVCGEKLIQVYIPVTNRREHHQNSNKRNNKLRKFDRMITGQFSFHYDTKQLARCIDKMFPDNVVSVSVKMHGTSFIAGNVLALAPKWGGLYKKLFLYLPKWMQKTKQEYTLIYSSRNVIKNPSINSKQTDGYYGADVWGEYARLLDGKIPKGVTIYGEIVGYITGTDKMIQKGYDYGCLHGTNKLMIYRVTYHDQETGEDCEYNIEDVAASSEDLIRMFAELRSRIIPFPLLYHGTLSDLYPDIPVDENWNGNVLAEMKKDKKHFGMEMDEPMCHNKVPREGIVLRIDDDIVNEAFKLKTDKFFDREGKMIDAGEVDMEMMENYDSEQ